MFFFFNFDKDDNNQVESASGSVPETVPEKPN